MICVEIVIVNQLSYLESSVVNLVSVCWLLKLITVLCEQVRVPLLEHWGSGDSTADPTLILRPQVFLIKTWILQSQSLWK